ncbi:MAG: 4-carboxymuconolactone decarboxylase [Sneathiella sp.]|nr:4-carboxymuconolactone decarboxylase [Sneathiella sp.]
MAKLEQPTDRYTTGRKTRQSILGEDHVARAEANVTDFDRPFQDLITEGAWGSVWSRDHWTNRERSMVTIALLAGLGHIDECAMHVRAAENTGASRDDIREAMLHVAVYAGVPAANSAIKVIKDVFKKLDADKAGGQNE